jgi:hypothetical protein
MAGFLDKTITISSYGKYLHPSNDDRHTVDASWIVTGPEYHWAVKAASDDTASVVLQNVATQEYLCCSPLSNSGSPLLKTVASLNTFNTKWRIDTFAAGLWTIMSTSSSYIYTRLSDATTVPVHLSLAFCPEGGQLVLTVV